MKADITTARFHLRDLDLSDVTERYLGWFRDPDAARYISAAAGTVQIADLREYVAARVGRDDILFLGIFDRAGGLHIGNIKYEPVDRANGYAVMGILLGDAAYRGRGVAAEVLDASARWLQRHCAISQIVLGVLREHTAAIRAYQAAGFVIEDSPYVSRPGPDAHTMVWRL